MRLLLVRHAPAEARGSGPDRARELTAKGRKRFARAVERLEAQGVALDAVWTSPWRRAEQTARLLSPLSAAAPESTQLLAQSPAGALLDRLLEAGPLYRTLALVGHEPWIGQLAALLLFGNARDASRLRFGKGSVAVLDGEPQPACMRLRSLQTLRELRS